MLKKTVLLGLAAYVVLYFLLLFFNLHLIPIAWLDEVMCLDPGFRLANGQGYNSYFWPQKGTEDFFLAYLPIQPLMHYLHQLVLPFDIYWVRFPWSIYLLLGSIMFYASMRKLGLSTLFSVGMLLLIINEKSLFETTRGVRVEPLMFLAICSAVYVRIKNRSLLQSIVSTTMVFMHPDVWSIALVLYLDATYRSYKAHKRSTKTIAVVLTPLIGTFLFLLFIDFDIVSFIGQFLHQGNDHSASGNVFHRLHAHFIDRFWPYYISQPWIPTLVYAALIYAISNIIKKQENYLSYGVLITHLVWCSILGPFPRYNSILIVISLLVLAKPMYAMWMNLKPNIAHTALLGLCILSCADVVIRHTMAIVQREERNPYAVIHWLQEELPKEDTYLITGSDIAYYAMAEDTTAGYFLYNIPPYKYDFNRYNRLLLLLDNKDSTCTQLAEYHIVQSYWSKMFGKKTYKDLYLQEVKSPLAYAELLLELDNKNRLEVESR